MTSRYDVVVVGGRVAGAASALQLARRGARVLVLEAGEYGSDTLSTHFIWPRGTRRLAEMGVLDALFEAGTPPITSISLQPARDLHLRSRPATPALCPRRTVLDRLLVDAAAAAGAELRHRSKVTGVLEEGGRVRGIRAGSEEVRADLVVGADGRQSELARMLGAERLESYEPQTAGFYAYFDALAVDGAEFRLREGRLTYAWPTNHGQACLYVAGRHSGLTDLRERVKSLGLAACAIDDDSLLERLRGARQSSPVHGFAGQGPVRRRSQGPGWVLIGDAASFKDPTAGMGISEALEDASWVAGWPLLSSDRERERRRVFEYSRRAAELKGVDRDLRQTYERIATLPEWRERFFAVLGGEVGPSDFFGQLAIDERWHSLEATSS